MDTFSLRILMRLHIFLFEVLNHSDLLDPDTLDFVMWLQDPSKWEGP
jgi:hypothetical protein